MTIGLFSERSGLKPKTLRYYEEVDLLMPNFRSANGYRQYEEDQVATALLIHSLRQAGVGIADIKQYLAVDRSGQERLLQRWRRDAQDKMLSLQIANQFFQGFHPQAKYLRLVRWDEPKIMAWFPLMQEAWVLQQWFDIENKFISRLAAIGFLLKQPKICYVRFKESQDGFYGEIGYEVLSDQDSRVDGFVLSIFPQALFAALDCNPERPAPCQPIFAAIRQSGFQLVETPIRQYTAGSGERYTLLVPVMLQTNSIEGE
jgi:DNA-binding transcriptional MerR regulator